jgi:ABC-2 type transport system permease protein
VVKSDYLESGQIRLVAPEPVGENVDSAMRSFLRANLIATQPAAVVQRLTDGDQIDVRTLDGTRQMASNQWWKMIIPIVAGMMLIVVINMSGGYLLQAVVEEKENRTMEIVVTSVSPEQLMVGKIVGSLSVGLTQVLIWTVVPFVGLLLARDIIPQLRAITIDPIFALVILLTVVPAFILIAALMAMVGATATEGREASQVAGLFTLPLAVPLWLVTPLITNPNGALSIGLSLFPLTAPISLPLRVGYANVPVWQIALSIGLLFASAAAALWFAGRAFRLGMLRYGKPISWKELFARRAV